MLSCFLPDSSNILSFSISEPFRALVTRDKERSNLDKFLGREEYLLKLRFTNIVACLLRETFTECLVHEGLQNCCIGIVKT